MSKKSTVSRRKFLQVTSIAAGATAFGGTVLSAVAAQGNDGSNGTATMTMSSEAASQQGGPVRGKMFFTNDLQFQTISEAAERIFPKDELGPGAKDLAVPFFIDNQLAAAYGHNAREYTKGPFAVGAPTQGQQTALLRKDVILVGIDALNAYAQAMYKKNYPEITDDQKDGILRDCEAGKVKMDGLSSSYFFSVLKEMVLGGVYADPIYNGNNNMDGWKMKEYPGCQMMYIDVIPRKEFQKIPPLSLADM